jgi:secreted trypsin-like serine protease
MATASQWQVRLGVHSWNLVDSSKFHNVREIVRHSSYDSNTISNDIAIMFLSDQPTKDELATPV